MAKLSNVTTVTNSGEFDELIASKELAESGDEFSIINAYYTNTTEYGRSILFFIRKQDTPDVVYGMFTSPDNTQREEIVEHFKSSNEPINNVYMVAIQSKSHRTYYQFSEQTQSEIDEQLAARRERSASRNGSSPDNEIPF